MNDYLKIARKSMEKLQNGSEVGEEHPPGPFSDWVRRPDVHDRPGWESPDLREADRWWAHCDFEDLPDLVAPEHPAPGTRPCPWCKRRQWWRSIHGAVICGNCHPPAAPRPVLEWLEPSEN